ncbi:uncharacterized protein LTR77_005288 [Saxophila tyrrhenica]|uniref:DUF1682-domain-containing protein n=1 Tax=Saxophila tyrrhenica TaxID=1690608 RepID=A0AAV9PCB7_9PEZI|nr:hypothetical protein LTR77_005288 [Saxophila tyrrhenica]
MADFLKNLLGGAKSVVSSASSDADDFADFATAASPVAPSHAASSSFGAATHTPTAGSMLTNLFGNPAVTMKDRPYTKWYRVWERTSLQDFYQEFIIIPILLLVVLVNLWGSYTNKQRAKQWAATHLPILENEFASVGFSGGKSGSAKGDLKAGSIDVPDNLLRQRQKNEYYTYATGRQNIAQLHVQLSLHKRYNPITWIGETIVSFFFDSMPAPVERVEATAYAFDGKEKALVAGAEGGLKDSSYDGFVFAVVHKDKMQQLRDDRYDLSLTATRDHAKLPEWATIMSESAEITEALLTPELLKAVEETGEDLEALIISDQPIDSPKKLNDTVPVKRVSLSTKLNTRPSSTALFSYFLRLPDFLVSNAHFRPEAMRRIRATREEEARKIRKADEDEKAEERRTASDKAKKDERERRLKNMTAEEQRKFLDREKKDEQKKGQKKRTMKA